MIGIIGAFQTEIDTILQYVDGLEEKRISIRTFYTGTIKGHNVVIVIAGIGKVNAAVSTSLLIENFSPDCVINIGVAGGQNGVKHKDVVVSSEVVYHDVDLTAFGTYPHGQMSGHEPTFIADKDLLEKTKTVLDKLQFPYYVGKIATGDQFVYSHEMVKEINKVYDDIYAIEMEAGAIAHVCTIYHVPFIVYRSISDILGEESQDVNFETFVEDASKNATQVLLKLIEVL
jgi:adenosylhomocysteine nucleosidase